MAEPGGPLEGGCFCGAIRNRARSVFGAVWCHCSLCRRFGVPAASSFNVLAPDFALLRGAPRAFASSSFFTRHFCPECGTHVFGTDARPPQPKVGAPVVSVAIGTLDDPAAVAARLHQWWGARVPWFESWAGLPRGADGALPHPSLR
jgi:hypothetical protein